MADNRARKGGRDDFYTKPETIDLCLHELNEYILFSDAISDVIEPSAGSGNWIKGLKHVFPKARVTALDTHPTSKKVRKGDWLLTNIEPGALVVGNPPFGFACSTAIKHFNHAAEQQAAFIAFVVPLTFRKASIQNRLSTRYELIRDLTLPKNSFYLADVGPHKGYDVPACFQIWKRKKKSSNLKKVVKRKPDWFLFVKKSEEWDYAVRRVGGRAGQILPSKDAENASESSTLFLKAAKGYRGRLRKSLEAIQPELQVLRNQTAGVRSVSKGELFSLLGGLDVNRSVGYQEGAQGIVSDLKGGAHSTPREPERITDMAYVQTFASGESYRYDAGRQGLNFLGLPESKITKLMKDGRVSGLIAESFVEARFRNVTATSNKGASYDLIVDEGGELMKLEHKMLTGAKVDLAPSAMKGAGRRFNAKAFAKWIRSIDGLVVSDYRNFPKINIVSFTDAELAALDYPRYIDATIIDVKIEAAAKMEAKAKKRASKKSSKSRKKKAA